MGLAQCRQEFRLWRLFSVSGHEVSGVKQTGRFQRVVRVYRVKQKAAMPLLRIQMFFKETETRANSSSRVSPNSFIGPRLTCISAPRFPLHVTLAASSNRHERCAGPPDDLSGRQDKIGRASLRATPSSAPFACAERCRRNRRSPMSQN